MGRILAWTREYAVWEGSEMPENANFIFKSYNTRKGRNLKTETALQFCMLGIVYR